MFSITGGKGFQITFENGYTVSCQFGANNYCENYYRHLEPDYQYGEERLKDIYSSKDCEVAIWNKKDGRNWVTGKIVKALGMDSTEDMVQADVTPEEVVNILSYVSMLKES